LPIGRQRWTQFIFLSQAIVGWQTVYGMLSDLRLKRTDSRQCPIIERSPNSGRGLLPAMPRFLNENPEWSLVHHTQANHGLMVLSSDRRDELPLPGTIKMAASFTKSPAGTRG